MAELALVGDPEPIQDSPQLTLSGSPQPIKKSYTKDELIGRVRDYAHEYGVRPDVALSVFNQESEFDPNAISKTGVRGISGMTMATGKKYGIMNEADRRNPGAFSHILDTVGARP